MWQKVPFSDTWHFPLCRKTRIPDICPVLTPVGIAKRPSFPIPHALPKPTFPSFENSRGQS